MMCFYTFLTEFCGDKHTFPTEFSALSEFFAKVCHINSFVVLLFYI